MGWCILVAVVGVTILILSTVLSSSSGAEPEPSASGDPSLFATTAPAVPSTDANDPSAASGSSDPPSVTWSPKKVSEKVGAGQSKSLTVSFTSSEDYESVLVRVKPELHLYLSAEPSTFQLIRQSEPRTLTLTLAPPPDAKPRTIDGTIQLTKTSSPGKGTATEDLPGPLQVELTIVGHYQPMPNNNSKSRESSPVTSRNASGKDFPISLRLDLRPFFRRKDFSESLYVSIRSNGMAQAVNYSPFGLSVLGFYEGSLPNTTVAELIRNIESGGSLDQLLKGSVGNGVGEGSLFVITVQYDTGIVWSSEGLLKQDSPALVRGFVEDVLSLRHNLKKLAFAPSYLRSEPLQAALFEKLRQGGKVRFADIDEFSSVAQTVLKEAIARHSDFFALDQAQSQVLTSWGPQFFILKDGLGYKLTLFEPRRDPASDKIR